MSGRRHSKDRDRTVVTHHYDVGNDFYRIVLGESMVYSCAYWRAADDPAYGLADAQRDKLDLVCRKLGLHRARAAPAARRRLRVGLAAAARRDHLRRHRRSGSRCPSRRPRLARERLAAAGVADRVEIRVQDYRDVDDGPYDVISSIGMAEHVGEEAYTAYAAKLLSLLVPGGRLLNHQISRRPGPQARRHVLHRGLRLPRR